SFNRRVIEPHLADKKQPLSLVFAIPDHPWVDTADGAAVRIAMTVGRGGELVGSRQEVVGEDPRGEAPTVSLLERRGFILPDLAVGPNVAAARTLKANEGVSNRGVIPHGEGMTVTEDVARSLGVGTVTGLVDRIRPYLNGRDLTQRSRGVRVIDMYGLDVDEVRDRFPAVYQWLYDRVKPERDQNK